MSMAARLTSNMSIAGKSFPRSVNLTGEATIAREVTLGVAKTGSLTTRTDNTTGTLTMAGGHGITTAAKIDLYWTNADLTRGSRRGVVVGTVSTNSVPISGGSGDNLPLANVAVTAQVVDSETFALVGDNTVAYGVYMEGPGTVVFLDGSNAELDYHRSTADGAWSFTWDNLNGLTSGLAGDTVATIRITQAESTTARTARVCALYN